MQNNNESMATVVETFFVEETTNLIHDGEALKTWNEKCEELGLVGQKQIVVSDKSPIPFLWMNQALINTFQILCPTKVDVKEYNKTPIPLEILELISLSTNEKYFDRIEIWYNEQDKDPVCIGYKFREEDKSDSEWLKQHYAGKYLMGRWADVKASLDTLIERAKKLFFQNETLRLKQEIRDRQRQLEDLQGSAEAAFSNGMPSTSGLPF